MIYVNGVLECMRTVTALFQKRMNNLIKNLIQHG